MIGTEHRVGGASSGRSPLVALLTCAFALAAAPVSAQDSDLVILRNGNPVLGEVKSLRRGSLSFDTEEMDVVEIDWEDVALLTSPLFFEVETSDGRQFFGSLESADTAVLVVVGEARSDTLAFPEVVEIGPIESGFWARTNGFVDVGSNIARANNLASVLLQGRFTYRGPKWGFDVFGDTYLQRSDVEDELGNTIEQRTSRASLQVGVNRFLGAKWVASAAGRGETNEELELDLRLLGILGGQYMIIRTQGLELSAGAGAAINDEQYVGEERATSAELVVNGVFDMFDVGDVDVFLGLDTYTNPKDERFRVNFDGRVQWEVIDDFFIGVTAATRLDSRPPSESASKVDYNYGISIGWSWS